MKNFLRNKRSQIFYDQYAPFYTEYLNLRKKYQKKVEDIMISLVSKPESMIDVGSANGLRSKRISQFFKIKKLVLVDSSKNMCALSKKVSKNTYNLDISDKEFRDLGKYDVVFCLQNVIGHIETTAGRKQAMHNLKRLIANNGSLFIDVHNRYNLNEYGLISVLKNIIKDIFKPSDQNGDFSFTAKLRNTNIPGFVHIFTLEELKSLIKDTGLEIKKICYIDYKTGEIRKNQYGGHILCQLKAN